MPFMMIVTAMYFPWLVFLDTLPDSSCSVTPD